MHIRGLALTIVGLQCLASPSLAQSATKAKASKGQSVDVRQIMRDTDRARGGLDKGLVWDITLESEEKGATSRRAFTIQALGNDALAVTTEPARNKGETFLFNDRVMWFSKRSLRKPVSLSARDRLSGQAANGDIASTHYARDYDAKVVGEDKVGDQDVYVLDLTAKAKNVTYDKIRYFVTKKGHLGIKAEFQSLDGTPLKIATFEYDNKVKVDGRDLPFVSKMTVVDAKKPENKSTITYESPRPANLSSNIFNVNNLQR